MSSLPKCATMLNELNSLEDRGSAGGIVEAGEAVGLTPVTDISYSHVISELMARLGQSNAMKFTILGYSSRLSRISFRIAATSFVAGCSSGVGLTQRNATPIACSISATSVSDHTQRTGSSTYRRVDQLLPCQKLLHHHSIVVHMLLYDLHQVPGHYSQHCRV